MGDLSPHFSTAEAIITRQVSYLAEQKEWWERVRPYFITYLFDVWEDCRELVGPLHINSAVRCPSLNGCHEIQGALHSAHLVVMGDGRIGAATDCVPLAMTLKEAYGKIATHPIMEKVDQLIIEYNSWIHIGWLANKPPRRQLLAKYEGVKEYVPYDEKDKRLA